MHIFAHRGLKLEQPENTLSAFQAAAECGFGIELDVRLRRDNELVCIHDRSEKEMLHAPRFQDIVEQVIVKFSKAQKAAVHVKYDEQGEKLLQILLDIFSSYGLHKKAFLFDLTLKSATKVRSIDPNIEIALSIGEENYSPTIYTWQQVRQKGNVFDAVWWDEWKIPGSVYNESLAKEIHDSGKSIYAISPELHRGHTHPHAEQGYEKDWKNFIAWEIEGVCTAYPREFAEIAQAK